LALVVFAQRLTGATTILGYHVRTMPGSGFCGTLVNANHAASIFALSALIASGLALELDGARRFALLWATVLSMAGLTFTAYRVTTERTRLVYLENVIVQLASEWGAPLSAAVLVLSLLAARRVRARLGRLELGTVGAACGVTAVLVHELGDFGLEVPGVAL